MINSIKNILFESKDFKALDSLKTLKEISLSGLNGSLISFLVEYVRCRINSKIIFISSNDEVLENIRGDMEIISDSENVAIISDGDSSKGDEEAKTISMLTSGTEFIALISKSKISSRIVSLEKYKDSILFLKKNEEYLFEEFLMKLEDYGFIKNDFVGEEGEYAVRGGIVDVFPSYYDSPVRIEFYNETIESIREFDITTQRSLREIQSAKFSLNIKNSDNAQNEKNSFLTEYFPNDCLIFLDEPEIIIESNNETTDKESTLGSVIGNKSVIKIYSRKTETDLNFHSHPQPDFRSNMKLLKTNLLNSLNTFGEASKFIISCSDDYQQKRMKSIINDFEEAQIEDKTDVLKESLSGGFIYPDIKLIYYTEHQIFSRYFKQSTKKKKRFRGISFEELKELNIGDLVVHRDFGVGVYSGLKTIKVAGGTQEVIKLSYAQGDTIFVNLGYVNLISKYSAVEGFTPKLTRLGGGEWDKIKEKTKKKVQDIARELIALYAKRKSEPGFAFSADTHWQRELEANFIYEDTPDQAKATDDVKADMESSNPMDRLICGDVGFGKTEVAVRAAFKAVMDNLQAAVLVPTTILAVQHFNTFRDRVAPFAAETECITRLNSKQEQKEILKKLEEGKIDILIGTHRLLSKDIKFKNLGLLIIDEEQRFGVKAKEKLRNLKPNVDTLTLTATPIPRTLNFSLLGARDLSIINTPPRNRKPIITEIIDLNWNLISEIIRKEIHRAGQVYFVNDKISTLQRLSDKIKSYVPESKIGIAHGQMDGNELEDIIVDFIEKKMNVLLCTKIIESGLDIPNVNTIIINNANMYGLAELYQLRGRVGRKDIQAYAYFISPPAVKMTSNAVRRLQAIEEYTDLGSGFNLAMRDMEIRGVGNLLGKEQSGFVQQIGFEMFIDVLEEAVTELKEKEFKDLFRDDENREKLSNKIRKKKQNTDFVFENDFNASITKEYITDDKERFNIYKRLYEIDDSNNIKVIKEELLDRFGKLPAETENLFRIIDLKIKALTLGLHKISLSENALELYFPESKTHPIFKSEFFNGLIDIMSKSKSRKYSIGNNKDRLVIEIDLRVDMKTVNHEIKRIQSVENVLNSKFSK